MFKQFSPALAWLHRKRWYVVGASVLFIAPILAVFLSNLYFKYAPLTTSSQLFWQATVIMCKNCVTTNNQYQKYSGEELGLIKDTVLQQLPAGSYEYVDLLQYDSGEYKGFLVNVTATGKQVLSELPRSQNHIAAVSFEPLSELQQTPLDKSEVFACTTDDECISVAGGSCGCSSGGTNVAINIRYEDYWQKSNHGNGMCLTVISNDASCLATPRCVFGKCSLK